VSTTLFTEKNKTEHHRRAGPSRPRRGENQASDGDDIVAVGGRKTSGTGNGSKARAPLVAAAGKVSLITQ
jgi:hypothetical protein